MILSTPVLPNLRAAFPDATIDFLTERGCRDVIDGNDRIDNLIVFAKTGMNGARILLDLRRARSTTWSSTSSGIPAARS